MEQETITEQFYEKVLRINKGDELYNELRTAIEISKRSLYGVIIVKFKIVNGAIYRAKTDLLWVLKKVQTEIIQEIHSQISSKHPGITRTIELLRRHYYWNSHKESVKKFIRNCHNCIRSKLSYDRQNGLLQPFPIPVQK